MHGACGAAVSRHFFEMSIAIVFRFTYLDLLTMSVSLLMCHVFWLGNCWSLKDVCCLNYLCVCLVICVIIFILPLSLPIYYACKEKKTELPLSILIFP